MTLEYGTDEDVWVFLGPDTRASLQERADQAAALGLEPRHPAAFLVAVWLPSEADIEAVTRVAESDDTTTLQIETYLGHTSEVTMLRTGEGWQVEFDLPSAPPVE